MARVLTAADHVTCPHGGAVDVSLATAFAVDGRLAVVAWPGPTQRVTGCANEPPCATASLDAGASPLAERGVPVCFDDATGTAFDADGNPAGALVVTPGEGVTDGGLQVS